MRADTPTPIHQPQAPPAIRTPVDRTYGPPPATGTTLADQGMGQGGSTRSHSVYTSQSHETTLGRGQQESTQGRPQNHQVGRASDQACSTSHPGRSQPPAPSSQDLISAACSTLYGSAGLPEQKSGYSDFVEVQHSRAQWKEPLGMPPYEDTETRAPKSLQGKGCSKTSPGTLWTTWRPLQR